MFIGRGVTQPATVNVTPVIIEDFFPSILELAGMKGKIHTPQTIDGRSFVAQLKGKQGDQKRPLYFHYIITGENGTKRPVLRKVLLLKETGS